MYFIHYLLWIYDDCFLFVTYCINFIECLFCTNKWIWKQKEREETQKNTTSHAKSNRKNQKIVIILDFFCFLYFFLDPIFFFRLSCFIWFFKRITSREADRRDDRKWPISPIWIISSENQFLKPTNTCTNRIDS